MGPRVGLEEMKKRKISLTGWESNHDTYSDIVRPQSFRNYAASEQEGYVGYRHP
jgi:hypothetical protein